MKIGYPCSNLRIGCSASRTFRLASFSPDRLTETVNNSLDCLEQILQWNANNGINYFRISSDTIPFASHPVMTVDWRAEFEPRFAKIGQFIRDHDMRINCHPGQYILLNAPNEEIVERSVAELMYTATLFDMMGLDHTHKMQIHTGGVYGDKPAAIERFIARYADLPEIIRRRLVIENDERQYSLADNLVVHRATGIPLLFDVFHHSIRNEGETVEEALDLFMPTWDGHGLPAMDYSSQNPDKQTGAHTVSVDLTDWARFAAALGERDVDVMLEIKDKEFSALAVNGWLASRPVDPPMPGPFLPAAPAVELPPRRKTPSRATTPATTSEKPPARKPRARKTATVTAD
ncbi:MAG TPA: UV DNA damage repair endonuclease UvsE [Thermomicrobiales bacterium]|jgi:UV DNA damage endonuclease|nr:UV DNA damage repair endonuclease UvsE [Thermomicrobiales bacterium]